jgi:hypothetical protein
LLFGAARRERASEKILDLQVILAGIAPTQSKNGKELYDTLAAQLTELAR